MSYVQFLPVGQDVTAEAARSLRGEHDLQWANAPAASQWAGWVTAIPHTTGGGGVHGALAIGDAAKLVLPFVTLHPSCESLSYGAVQVTEAAWDRFISTSSEMLIELRRSTAHAYSYAQYASAMHSAEWTDAQSAAMTLRADDLEGVDAYRTAGDGASDAGVGWLVVLTLGELTRPDGRLEPMSQLMHALGCHASRGTRASAPFRRAAAAVEAAAERNDGVGLDTDDDVAAAVANLLRQAAMPPELRVLPPAAARLRAVRQELAHPIADPEQVRLLSERAITAVTLHPSLRALLGASRSGDAAPMAPGLAAALLRDVAMRGDVVGPSAPFGPSALRRLAAAT
eukprot:6214641-Pleurochrysis_carterae.AAC.1